MGNGENIAKYSVLMSVYEGEKPKYLKTSIESMINQTLKPDEIVIVKDGPLTDELENVIQEFIKVYPDLFTIVALEHNIGLGLALNEGLKRCRNELVARMDTDDISIEERCELQVERFLEDDELSIVGAMVDEFDKDPNTIISSRVVPTNHEDILKFSKRRNPFNHPTVMYKRSAVLDCGGYRDFRRNQDMDLFIRMLNRGYIAANIDASLVLFRANEENLKRRKSWVKCKNHIKMIYNFWRDGHSSLMDLIIVTIGQLVVYISPLWFWEWLSDTFLRRVHSEQED